MPFYRVTNTASGAPLGIYEGATEDAAILAMLRDGGLDEAPDPDLEAVPVVTCAYCGEHVEDRTTEPVPLLGDDHGWVMLARQHAPGCEWIATRAHRLEVTP